MIEEYNDILTLKDMQTILKVGKNSALDLIHEGDIEAFMIKGRWGILKLDLLAYIRHMK